MRPWGPGAFALVIGLAVVGGGLTAFGLVARSGAEAELKAEEEALDEARAELETVQDRLQPIRLTLHRARTFAEEQAEKAGKRLDILEEIVALNVRLLEISREVREAALGPEVAEYNALVTEANEIDEQLRPLERRLRSIFL